MKERIEQVRSENKELYGPLYVQQPASTRAGAPGANISGQDPPRPKFENIDQQREAP